jgi:DNA mismatch endonuclease (patch repair protein)
MDFLPKTVRSELMGRIKSRNTRPEMMVRQFLHSRGFRYRLHRRDLPGTPDIVFPQAKLVVFVHGCFWHACPNCPKGARLPEANRWFWSEKIGKNVARDRRQRELIEAAGWHVVTIWECQTRDSRCLDDLAASIRCAFRRSSS